MGCLESGRLYMAPFTHWSNVEKKVTSLLYFGSRLDRLCCLKLTHYGVQCDISSAIFTASTFIQLQFVLKLAEILCENQKQVRLTASSVQWVRLWPDLVQPKTLGLACSDFAFCADDIHYILHCRSINTHYELFRKHHTALRVNILEVKSLPLRYPPLALHCFDFSPISIDIGLAVL